MNIRQNVLMMVILYKNGKKLSADEVIKEMGNNDSATVNIRLQEKQKWLKH